MAYQACSGQEQISQLTLLAMIVGTKLHRMLIELGLQNWRIFSFDPLKKEACLHMYPPSGFRTITVKLEPLI